MQPPARPGAVSLTTDRSAWLRQLLREDYFTDCDWEGALADAARLTCDGLCASTALIALWDSGTGWEAVTDSGEKLTNQSIRLVASLSVLDRVRSSGKPVLSAEAAPALLKSKSASVHQISSVLAVPVLFWERGEEGPRRSFGGCLYAHRRGEDPAFEPADVELFQDLARVAERTLNVLRKLRGATTKLAALEEEVREIREEEEATFHLAHCQSRDPAFAARVLEPLRRAAKAGKVGLLLLGPTGSGKNHLAHAFHFEGPRRHGPFVTLDCSQVTSSEALGAELFGYAKKSGFSAPAEGRPGKARLADNGTLFVDEVGSMPLELQQRLLRLIETGRFSPLGSAEEETVDVQVIAAANHDLSAMVRKGTFREDLLWRISEVTATLPPLSGRPADIPALAQRFLAAAAERFQRKDVSSFTRRALDRLAAHDWSQAGNIRGLEHAVARSVLLSPAGSLELDADDLVLHGLAMVAPAGAAETAASAVGDASAGPECGGILVSKLAEHQGVLARMAADPEVAAALGIATPIPLSTLRVRLVRMGLKGEVDRARRAAEIGADDLVASVRTHGSAAGAAAALGISADSLYWRLRREGLSVRAILEDRA